MGIVTAGVGFFATDESAGIAEVARLVEERGFDSIWLPEHTHIPAARTTPWPGGTALPRQYTRTLDPFVALTAAAGVTTTLKLGFGICLLIQRDAITTAKAVASLDMLSAGRVIFGIGAGWNVEEMLHHGTDPSVRMGLLRERVEAMRRIWSEDEASYAGRHVQFDRVLSWPKPVQRPHPPILVGGNGAKAEDRVLRYGDGWMPSAGLDEGDTHLLQRISALRDRATAAGRDMNITVVNMSADARRMAMYAESGFVDRMVFFAPSAERELVEQHLDLVHDALVDAGLDPDA